MYRTILTPTADRIRLWLYLGAPETKITARKFWIHAQVQHEECAVGKK